MDDEDVDGLEIVGDGHAVTPLSVAAVRGRGPLSYREGDLLESAVIARLLQDPSEVYTAARQCHLASWTTPALMHDHLPALLAVLSTDNLTVRLEVLLSLVNYSADQLGASAIVEAGGLLQLSRQLMVAVSATGAEAQCVPPLCAALRNFAVDPETTLHMAACVPSLLRLLPNKAVPWEARHDALLVLWQVRAFALHVPTTCTACACMCTACALHTMCTPRPRPRTTLPVLLAALDERRRRRAAPPARRRALAARPA